MSDESPKQDAPKEAPRKRSKLGRPRKRRKLVARLARPLPAEAATSVEKPIAKPAPALRSTGTIALVAAIALGAGGIYLASRGASMPEPAAAPVVAQHRGLRDSIPDGAFVVVTADVRALRASPLVAPYLGGARSVPGFGDVQKACGFDPIASVDEVAVVVPESGDSEFGVIAIGGFSDTNMLECATKVVRARGGNPVTSAVGSFHSVRDASSPASGETAARPGGPLVWSGGAYLKTLLDAADGKAPTLPADSLHEQLRATLQGYETLQATVVLSPAQRATISDEIAKAQGRAPEALAHVSGAAVGLRLVQDRVSVLIVVMADDPSRAPDVRQWLESAKTDATSSMASRVLGASALLERAKLDVVGSNVRATLDANVADIEDIVDRALKLRAILQSAPPQAPSAPPSASASVAPSASAAPSASVSAAPSAAPSASTSARPKKRRHVEGPSPPAGSGQP